jgi:subtilisin family serine protease
MPSRQIVIAASVAGVLAAGALVVVATRDAEGSDDGGYEPRIREELLDDVRPDPACPDATAGPELEDGQVWVNVVRVVDGCLAYSSEAVAATDLDDRLRELRADPDVVAADRAVERQPTTATSRRGDEPQQWALEPEHLDGEGVRALWPADATDVKVAIIDTGIDLEHSDLAGQTVDRAPWSQRYEGKDDSHGSHVGGIVAAADDGAGVVGLTPAARLIDVQYSRDGRFAGPSNDLGEYVRWAVDHGADVINMSLAGNEPSDTELTAVLYAERQGVVVVAAAGNCGSLEPPRLPWNDDPKRCDHRHEIRYPATYPTVLSVAAHTQDNERAGFSSANSSVDVAAPGADILSDCLTEDGDTTVTCEASGTSQAAPYVAATAALLRARHPEATPEAIRNAITRSARTDDRQPLDTRTDEYGWGVLDPEAAAEYLDEHPGAPQESGSSSADRTVAAFRSADTDQLFVLDDGIPHPVLELGPDSSVHSIDWSPDHTRLVGSADEKIFTWTGPGSTPVERACDLCEVAYIDGPSDHDVVAGLTFDGTITSYDVDTLEPTGTATVALTAPEQGFVLYGDVGGKLLVAHSTSTESSGPDTLWLVDPMTGEATASHGGDNTGVAPVAVDAAGDRVASVSEQPGGGCGDAETVHVLAADDLSEIATAEMPTSELGDLEPEDVFFNGEALYATMVAWGADLDGGLDCTKIASAGVWRLDEEAGTWEQVDDEPVLTVRPIEGLTEDPGTGRLAVAYDGKRGTFEPTGASGSEHVQFGEISGVIWATPTREEVDLGQLSSTPPVDDEDEEPEPTDPGEPADNSMEAAVARFEDYLHALGEGDIDTVCEIAGPAAQRAEDQGFGPCESTFGTVVDMISPEQAEALKTATVNLALIESTGPGQIHIPVEAVNADVTFTESDLGSYTIAYQDGGWFIID